MRCTLIVVVLALVGAARAAPPATAPTDRDIAAAVAQLGDDSFEVRERASKYLWSQGVAAEPALREAARSADPEVSRRAGEILEALRFGIAPGTQQDVLGLVRDYAGAEPAGKKEILDKLLGLGNRAIGPVLKLLAGERDAAMRDQILERLSSFGRLGVAHCLAMDDVATAQAILDHGSRAGQEQQMQNLAALLLQRGGLEQGIADSLKRDNTPPALMATLLRIKGDFASALKYQPEEGAQTPSILWDMKDFKALARLQDKAAIKEPSADNASLAAALWWLARDQGQLGKAIDRWQAMAGQQPDNGVFTGRALLLLDRVDDGMKLLTQAQDRHEPIALLALRYDFDELLAVVKRAEDAKGADLREVRLEAARCLYRAGERDQAARLLDAVVKADDGKCDPWAWRRLITVELAMNRRADALNHLLAAIHQAGDGARLDQAFDAIFPENGPVADALYRALRALLPDEKEMRSIERIEEALAGKAAARDLEAWAVEATTQALAIPVEHGAYVRDSRLEGIAALLLKAGCEQAALKVIDKLTEVSESTAGLFNAGDYYAQKKDYAQAATWYGRAWGKDRSSPKAAWLYGWATSKSGREPDGRRLMDTALILPLAEDSAREELASAMESQGEAQAAREQRQLMMRLADWDSHPASVTRRRLAGEMCDKGDALAGVELWRQGLITLFHSSTSFVDSTAYLIVPRDMHRIRGDALLSAGRADEAVAEYQLSQSFVPSDVSLVIEVAPKLEKAGRRADADKLYARSVAVHDKAIAALPKAAMLHNDLAWLAAKCRRDLDKGLEHAKIAANLDPASAAILDTLAETHFARGEKQEAIAAIQRAITVAGESNPIQKYLHEQLARFEGREKAEPATRGEP